jgi:ABC-2 type transport system ATP-binding protein
VVPPFLKAEGLRHSYGARRVLDGLSFEVARGEVFGFLGPNGAGKTTTFHILTGLLSAQQGSLFLEGQPVRAGDRRLRSRLGVVFQAPSLDLKLTARENLAFGAALYTVPRSLALPRIDRLLAFAELSDRADESAGRLSGGMRRRLELARALVHRPSLLVMDEPTSGLDEASFQRTWTRLAELRSEMGLTVLITTHRPEEAERCQRLLVLHQGRAVALGSPDVLRERVSGDVISLQSADPEGVARTLRERFALDPRVVDGQVLVERERGHEWVPRLVEAFPAGALRSVSLRRPSLGDVFLKLTGEGLEAASEGGAASEKAA